MPPNSPKKMKQRATRLDPQNALFSRFLIGVRYQPFCPYVPCGRRGGQGPASSGGGARCCRRRRSRKCRRCRLGCRRRQRSIASRGPPAGRSRRHGHGAAQGRSGSRSCRDGEGRRREHGCGERGGRGRRRSFFFFFCFFFFFFFFFCFSPSLGCIWSSFFLSLCLNLLLLPFFSALALPSPRFLKRRNFPRGPSLQKNNEIENSVDSGIIKLRLLLLSQHRRRRSLGWSPRPAAS